MTTIINGSSPSITFSDGSAQTSATQPFQNRIINGAMVIDQRNAGAAVTISSNGSSYLTDRFRADAPVDQSMTFQQQTSVIPNGFSYALKVTAGTATTNASNQPLLTQFIEGFNMADLKWGTANAKTVTLSFQVYSSLTGTFGVCFENNNADRGYIASYTINSANTWETKTITIAGDTSGTWETTNQRGLAIFFDLGYGTTYSSAASTTWANVERGLTGGVKLAANTGATWYITGVQLEVGSTATSFDYRPFGTELALCQRYYYRVNATSSYTAYGHGHNTSSTAGLVIVRHPLRMRVQPTSLDFSTLSSTVLAASETTVSSASIDSTYNGTDATGVSISGSGFTTGFTTLTAKNSTSSYLGFSSEL